MKLCRNRNQSGQTTIEYALLLALVAVIFTVVVQFMKDFDVANKIKDEATEDIRAAYKYGSPVARGYDEGQPKQHPRITAPPSAANDNFRMFLNNGANN